MYLIQRISVLHTIHIIDKDEMLLGRKFREEVLKKGTKLEMTHARASIAELAQSVERTTLNRVVVGSIPTFGVLFFLCDPFVIMQAESSRSFIGLTLPDTYHSQYQKDTVRGKEKGIS